jgi:hypothetical protein
MLRTPWRHAAERETSFVALLADGEDAIAIQRDAVDGLPACGLTLWQEGDGYKVTNIVPLESGELGIECYNTLLDDFVRRVAEPASEGGELFELEISSPLAAIEDWMSPETATALRRFSALANKSTGSAHPLDRQRWFAFVIHAYRDNRRADTGQLTRWLIEVEGWPPELAHELAGEYETGIALLEQFERSER